MTPNQAERDAGRTLTTQVLMAALLMTLAWTPSVSAEESPGKQLFLDNKCNMCHSVDALEIERTSTSDKMKAKDLSTVGDELELEWAVKFIKKEVEREGKTHKKIFKGSDDDAAAIAAWLLTLKTPAE
jgi:cytochrome c553